MAIQTPSAKAYYRPELDVVRLIAFLLVSLHHNLPNQQRPSLDSKLHGLAPILEGASSTCRLGLSLFFTLSAFLICQLLLNERKTAGTVSVGQFYIRRILRIWPLYYLGLVLGVVFAILVGDIQNQLVPIAWFAVFMGAWYSVVHGWFVNPVNPLWSISVEEQFYLFAPWIVKYLSRRLLYGFCLVLILISNCWLYSLGKERVSDNMVWANSFVQFECFAGGILLCLFLRGRTPVLALWQRFGLLFLAAASWLFASFRWHSAFLSGSENPGSWPLIGGYALGTFGSVLVLIAFLGTDPKFFPRWAIYLGRISFGLYVFHQFVSALVRPLIWRFASAPAPSPIGSALRFILEVSLSLALNILVAALSYRYLETPFLRMKNRHAIIQSRPI